jgi:hypothetical protein
VLTKVDFDFIDVAPAPVFAGLHGFHDGMFGAMKVFSSVFVLGRIAAADMATFQAETEMNPEITGFQTLLATLGGVRFNVLNLIKMGACLHISILQLLIEDAAPVS